MKKLNLMLLAAFVWTIPGSAQQMTMRANVTGNAVDGKCTIEVIVDGSAEVEVQGSEGRIRNLSGQGAVWRRFVCNGPIPANPRDFRFRGIDGRGNVQLLQDPRQAGGRIVFRIDDPQGGREGYTVDLEWRGAGGGQWNNQDNRGWIGVDQQRYSNNGRGPNGPNGLSRDPSYSGDRGGPDGPYRDPRYYNDRGRWNQAGTAEAIRVCQAATVQRIQRDGFQNVIFRNVTPDNNPGRNDYVVGFATARQGRRRPSNFEFSCSVNLANGQVRSVDVNRRN